jgi:hypothetical protein
MQTALNMSQPAASESAPLAAEPQSLMPSMALPTAERFFWGAITSGFLAHGYVLKGKNTAALYHLVLTIAQIANCRQRPEWPGSFTGRLADLACGQCKECRWVEQNAHPAVLTVSRLTYQVTENKERPELLSTEALEKLASKSTWPTKIKTGQVEVLIHQLSVSTDAVRVVIFTDAEELPSSAPSPVAAPFEWRCLEAAKDRSFHIRPLKRSIFSAESVNRFLKILEEPPPRTLFFFLADTEEQLLETVVSRCQVVPCLSPDASLEAHGESIPAAYQSFLDDFLGRLRQGGDAFGLALEVEAFFIQEQGLKAGQILDVMQVYLRQRYMSPSRAQGLDEVGFSAYKAAQLALDEAQRMIAAKTNEGQSLLNLFLTWGVVLKNLPVH